MKKTSGAIANRNGLHLEDTIENILKRYGYMFVDKNRFIPFSKVSEQKIYSKQIIIGQTIYNTNRKCDFILFHPEKFKSSLIIESKWQESSGSVDEKYPFLVLNIKKLAIDTLIVLDGGAFKKGAKDWLEKQISGSLKKVLSLSEFIKISNQDFF